MALPFVAALLIATGPGPAAPELPTGEPVSMRLEQAPFGAVTPELALYEPPPTVSRLALASSGITSPREPRKPKAPKPAAAGDSAAAVPAAPDENAGLGPERAKILLQSLTVPGWGQATLGHKGSAKAFALVETAIWTSFVAFKVQESMRTDTYLRTAQLSAGIDLRDDDDELRRIVGAYASSDEYNLLVVSRDAANLYLSDPENPDMAGYRAYIEQHSLKGDQTWNWSDEQAFLKYGGQREFAQKAGLRANTALGLAIANRLVSALHAARLAGRAHERAPQQGWRLEVEPGLAEPGRYRAALTKNF